MKKVKVVGKRILSFLCAVLVTVSMFFPGTTVYAANEGDSDGIKLSSVELSGGAVVFTFGYSGEELFEIVQKGLKVLIGEKEIPYEPNYSYYGYNAKGTYVKSGNAIYFYPSDFEEGDNIVTLSTESATHKIGVKKTTVSESWFGNEYAIETFEIQQDEPQEPEQEETVPEKKLFIRLVGSFASKMVGEEDIDAISSATTVYYLPENTNSVKLQAALVDYAASASDVTEEDWHELSFFNQEDGAIRVNDDPTKTRIVMEPECPGVEGSYNIFTGDVILSGKPESAGTYNVYVDFADTEGRTATSNGVTFTVNGLDEKLVDRLTLENSTQTSDGQYIYDQEPWYIEEFGQDTVVVPKEIKAWYGSHTMGTYSELGKVISLTNGEEPVQTLVIPEGCNLTMVNVRVHSGVKIVVQSGARFSIRQSTIEGIVEVENGGSFSCDYVDYGDNAGFIYGSAVNGQIRLKDGSTIESARIISHTNYSARDDVNRRNQAPVVVVEGNVNVKGDVYILADEAPNGSYGQTALQVNGTLNIPEGSTVAAFGGGSSNLTAKGGDAVVMAGGLVQGQGNLIAVGGFGMNLTADRSLLGGGAAISGDGKLDVQRVYAEGGSSFDTLVEPVQGNILVSTNTKVTAFYGKNNGETSDKYWHGTGDNNTVPVVSQYFENSGNSETEPTDPEPSEPSNDEKKYKDGTYIGVGQGKKGDITLSVTISGGKVTDISEVSQNETPSFWEKAKALLETIKNGQPGAEDVDAIDTVTGATLSSKGIKEAVMYAYNQAAKAAENEEELDITDVTLSGSGTWSDPYRISNVKELMKFAQNVDDGTNYSGEYVALTEDIDLSKVENFNTIGTEDGFSSFAGTFDGNGHTISNMKIKAENAANAGLFTVLNSNAVVKNLKLVNAKVEASGDYSLYAGLLAGNIKKAAMIDHCEVSGTLIVKTDTQTVEAGGIVGNMMLKSVVFNCSSDVKITAELSEGNVADFGGIAGLSKMNALVLNSSSKGTISVSGSDSVQAGGIIGNAMGKTFNVVSSVNVQSTGNVGSVFGLLDSFATASDYYTTITDIKAVGNTVETPNTEITEKQLNSNISGLHQTYSAYDFYKWVESGNSFKLSEELWHETAIDASIFDGGDGSKENPYKIATKEQLVNFAASLDTEILYDGKYVELTADIDISDIANWEPIGKSEFAFNGSFDGNGHTISGLKEGTKEKPRKLSTNLEDFSNALGLFGTLGVDAVVKNVNLTEVEMYVYRDDSSFVGGIVGYMQGLTDEGSRKGAIIDNCYVQGVINSTTHEKNAYVGGIAARQYKGAIINCHSDVDLRSTVEYGESIAAVGGITGMTNRGLVANCYSEGSYFGSMVRDIENEIEGMSSVGGLIGVDAGDMVNCYVSGNTTSEHYSIYTGAVTGWITGIGKAYQCYYDQNTNMFIAGRREAQVQPYGTKTVGGVNEEGVAYEGGVADWLDPYNADTYAKVADKLNDNFSSFAIDITKYDLSNDSLRKWTYNGSKVVLGGDYAIATYVQPEAEKVHVMPLVMQDGTWYGRDSAATVTVKIEVKEGAIVAEDVLTGSKDDTESYEKALERAKSKAIYGDWTGYGKGDVSKFAGGNGTKENPYLIANEEQLRYIAKSICEDETWDGKYFKQTGDITLSGEDWTPIGFAVKAKIKGDPVLYSAYPFRGCFDGGNHTISGMKIGDRTNPASMYTAAMFGFTGGDYESNLLYGDDVLKVELKNINLRDIFINNEVPYDTYTAGLVGTGQNGVFIDNCSVTGKISVKADDIASRGAGLAASMLRGAVTNSWTDVTIRAITEEGDVYAGGMFSVTNRINAINCYTLGDVYGTANTNNKVHIGGFTGMAGAFQYNCYAMGNVTSSRPTIDIGIADGRIANIAYDRNCYFNSDAMLTENGVVLESVYTGADGTGSSKDTTFGKTAAEIGSQAFADLLNKNVDNVVSELEAADEELGGIMSIYYQGGASGLKRWKIEGGKAVLVAKENATESGSDNKPGTDNKPGNENKPSAGGQSGNENQSSSTDGQNGGNSGNNESSSSGAENNNNNSSNALPKVGASAVLGASKSQTATDNNVDKKVEQSQTVKKNATSKKSSKQEDAPETEVVENVEDEALTQAKEETADAVENTEDNTENKDSALEEKGIDTTNEVKSDKTEITESEVPLSDGTVVSNPVSPVAIIVIVILAVLFVSGTVVIGKRRFKKDL